MVKHVSVRFAWHDSKWNGRICIRGLERKKEKGRRFITLIYKTASEHLRRYLKEVHGDEYPKKLKYDTPLFLGREGKRHATSRVQEMMRKIAPDSGIAGTRQDAGDINPLRPHALRASFSDQMAKAGASKMLIDYLQGHKLSFDTAYFGGEEGLRESYVKYAQIALEPKPIKPATELADSIEKQGIIVSNLAAEVKKLRQENAELKEWKKSVEEDREYIRYMKEEVKHFREGGIIIHYTGDISEEELREIIKEARQGKLLPKRKQHEAGEAS